MFSNGNSTPATFASINGKIGKFVVSTKNAEGKYDKTEFAQMRDVTLTRIKMEDDEYEGQPVRKVRMTFEGKTGRAIVDINASTYAAAILMARLSKADLSNTLGLTVQQQLKGSTYKTKAGTISEPLSSDITTVSVYQGEGYIQLDGAENPPKTEMVKVGSKEVANTEARDAFVVGLVEALAAKLGTVEHHDEVASPAGAPKAELPEDDVPF